MVYPFIAVVPFCKSIPVTSSYDIPDGELKCGSRVLISCTKWTKPYSNCIGMIDFTVVAFLTKYYDGCI